MILHEKYSNTQPKNKRNGYLNKNFFLFILALTLSSHVYSETDNGGVIHFYGALTASGYQNIINDNMLEPNCWDKFGKVVTRKVNMDSLIKQQQKLLAKYGKTRFLWLNKNRKQGMLEISYY